MVRAAPLRSLLTRAMADMLATRSSLSTFALVLFGLTLAQTLALGGWLWWSRP